MTVKAQIDESEMKARFLLADIISLLGNVPDDALPDVTTHLERTLESVRAALEAKKRETIVRVR
jgi:hypothetical protein